LTTLFPGVGQQREGRTLGMIEQENSVCLVTAPLGMSPDLVATHAVVPVFEGGDFQSIGNDRISVHPPTSVVAGR
jgi:hypothetical protein